MATTSAQVAELFRTVFTQRIDLEINRPNLLSTLTGIGPLENDGTTGTWMGIARSTWPFWNTCYPYDPDLEMDFGL